MNNDVENSLGTIKIARVKAALAQIEQYYSENYPEMDTNEIELSFEYIIGSFYPLVYSNILERIKEERTQAYIQGFEDGKRELAEEIPEA